MSLRLVRCQYQCQAIFRMLCRCFSTGYHNFALKMVFEIFMQDLIDREIDAPKYFGRANRENHVQKVLSTECKFRLNLLD